MEKAEHFMTERVKTQAAAVLPAFAPGSVWLAGAGPGDAGLLTLLAAYAISEADCIFYDALIDESCLRFARPQAALRCVGKRGGHISPRQEEITAALIRAARSGQKTLRLKGGDPLIFGRGAEEALALFEAGISFRIIPGVSAAPAAAAYAGIPLSLRRISQSFTCMTAHDETGALPRAVNWAALAQGADVLVFYMAARQIEALCAALLGAGRAAAEPMAFVINAGRADQRLVITALGQAAEAAKTQGLRSPAIVILGETVALHEKLGWFARQKAEETRRSGREKARQSGEEEQRRGEAAR